MKEPKVKIGDRFGKLTVVEGVEVPIITKKKDENGEIQKELTGKTRIDWLCKCDCGETITLTETTLLKKRSSLRSCNKCLPEKDIDYVPEKMTFEENQDWEELYEYVKKDILGYEVEQKLPQYITIRLLGLARGKHMANNRTVNNANYSYKTILNTFKFCSADIQKAIRTNNFSNEQHKINYVLKIIEKNINDVYIRMKSIEKAKKESESTVLNTVTYTGAEYQKKTKEVTNKLLDELW